MIWKQNVEKYKQTQNVKIKILKDKYSTLISMSK